MPPLLVQELGHDLLGAHVAEVEVGRKTAGGLGLGPVALVQVSIEPVVEKFPEGVTGGLGTSAHGRRRDSVVDRQF